MHVVLDRVTDRSGHRVCLWDFLRRRPARVVQMDEGHPLVLDFGTDELRTSPIAEVAATARTVTVRTGERVYHLRMVSP